jgi:hypothetical protein
MISISRYFVTSYIEHTLHGQIENLFSYVIPNFKITFLRNLLQVFWYSDFSSVLVSFHIPLAQRASFKELFET